MKSYITIRDCLTYTTGIQADAVGPMKVLQKSKYETLEDEVSAFASKREIATNPGTRFFYRHIFKTQIYGTVGCWKSFTKGLLKRFGRSHYQTPKNASDVFFRPETGGLRWKRCRVALWRRPAIVCKLPGYAHEQRGIRRQADSQ